MVSLLKAAPVIDSRVEVLKQCVGQLKEKGITPFLQIIIVGQHPPSLIYTKNKQKFSEKIGARCEIINLEEKISSRDFLQAVERMVQNPKVHGCLIQLPLPPHLSHLDLGRLIPPEKDVDGFHPDNLYRLMSGEKGETNLIPCTPKGIMTLLDYYKYNVEGKHVVIIGRSLIVGRPLALLFTNFNATVTLCHSKSRDLPSYTQKADFIVTAIGKPKFLNATFLSKDKKPVIIDVGINSLPNQKICGDVDQDSVMDYVSALSPVPGGVGPLTILSLAQNLLISAKNSL